MKTLEEILASMESVNLGVQPVYRSTIAEKVGLPGFLIEDDRILDEEQPVFVEKPIHQWMCTDTMVGFSVIYMSGRPVAYTMQLGRKMPKDFYWINGIESVDLVFKRCLTWIKPDYESRECSPSVYPKDRVPASYEEFYEWDSNPKRRIV